MTTKYTTTKEHIVALRKQGLEWDVVVKVISEEWDMKLFRANLIVNYWREIWGG